jgi:hypothetical protein
MNRLITAGMLAAGLALCAHAQEQPRPATPLRPGQPQAQKSQADLKKLREEKLAKPVFQHAPWVTDYDAARATAEKEGKLIFEYFTRSYAA